MLNDIDLALRTGGPTGISRLALEGLLFASADKHMGLDSITQV